MYILPRKLIVLRLRRLAARGLLPVSVEVGASSLALLFVCQLGACSFIPVSLGAGGETGEKGEADAGSTHEIEATPNLAQWCETAKESCLEQVSAQERTICDQLYGACLESASESAQDVDTIVALYLGGSTAGAVTPSAVSTEPTSTNELVEPVSVDSGSMSSSFEDCSAGGGACVSDAGSDQGCDASLDACQEMLHADSGPDCDLVFQLCVSLGQDELECEALRASCHEGEPESIVIGEGSTSGSESP